MSYSSEVLADGPVVYYRLGDATGPAIDSSGNGRSGAYVNSPTRGAPGALQGDPDNAVTMARANSQRVTIPTAGLPSGASPYTLEVWVKPTSIDSSQGLIGIGAYGTGRAANALRLDGSAASPGIANYWWAADLTKPAPGLGAGSWHHVVATWDGTTRSLYLNSTLLGADTPGAPNVVISDPSLGRTQSGEFLNGDLDEVAVYSFALSQARITAHYRAGVPPPPPPTGAYATAVLADAPLGYYRLGEPTGSLMRDSSGNERNGGYSAAGGVAGVLGQPGLLVGDTDTAALSPRGTVPTASWMDSTGLTLEALIRPTQVGVIQSVLDRDQQASRTFQWRIDSTNKMQLIYWTGSAEPLFVNGNTTLAANTTYHVAATWDGATARLYLNGAPDGTLTSGTGPLKSGSGNALNVGMHQSDQLFQGVIDEVAYYGTALSAPRIAAHYAAATTAPPSPVSGSAAAVLPTFGAAFAGASVPPSTTGTLAGSLQPVAVAMGGASILPGETGSLALALPPFTGTLAGTSVLPAITGTLAATLPALAANVTAAVPVGMLSAFTADLAGAVQVVTHTDTTYANDSYTYGGTALVDYDTPVAPPPPGLVRRDVRRVHQSLPTPDLVRGRPQ